MSGQHFEPDTALGQVMYRVHQIPQIAAQTIQFPHDQRIAFPQRLFQRI